MAIFVTGDTHGADSLGLHSVDGFMPRLNTKNFPQQAGLTKDDYVVICGDFGGVWKASRKNTKEPEEEKYALDWLESKPFTTLFVPGNHENYDRLTGCHDPLLMDSWFLRDMPPEEKEKLKAGYPRKLWHGGFVREIRPSVLMLERGEIFELNGAYCFAFGGARSHDIADGILDPAAYPDEDSFRREYRARRYSMIRVKHVSWWEDEMPTDREMEQGRRNIREFMREHEKIDFVFTHDAPASDKMGLGYRGVDALNMYLDSLRGEMCYGQWFYGHLHENRQTSENHFLLYDRIMQIHP